ncbi:Txe/YoeB family addiction module toxin [Accumulibacter sp.]|uniref:Txe/YoeB family addiction module toxin n=1 Tax=Accumulibacter sp. TaxID=2053492 RepID=UPI002D1FBE36|nr:Txe/YoeB family addiction module toxin [Accumulibacter sp.]
MPRRQRRNRKMPGRIDALVCQTRQQLFGGVGKPDPLRHAVSGCWSRRFTEAHRMVYRVGSDELEIAQLRFDYRDTQVIVDASAQASIACRPKPARWPVRLTPRGQTPRVLKRVLARKGRVGRLAFRAKRRAFRFPPIPRSALRVTSPAVAPRSPRKRKLDQRSGGGARRYCFADRQIAQAGCRRENDVGVPHP